MSKLSSIPDGDLLKMLVIGNQNAYEELYYRYHDLLYGYIYNKLKDKEEAQDVVHDVLIKLWTNRAQLENVKSLKSYLFTSVRNKAFDFFAQKKISDKYLDSLQDALAQYSPTADYTIREKDLDVYIKKQISLLAPKMREVFELSRYEYRSNAEIAELLGISKNTVETQIKRALKVLKYKLTTLLSIILFFFS